MTGVDVRLVRSRNAAGDLVVRLGVGLLDDYLEFVAGRCRPNTVLAVACDLKVFFTVVGKPVSRGCWSASSSRYFYAPGYASASSPTWPPTP